MTNDTKAFAKRARTGLAAGLLVTAMAGLAWTGFGGDKENVDNPPAEFKVDNKPITREGNLTTSFAPVVKKSSPSVVNVFTTTKPRRVENPYNQFQDDPFFRRFFGGDPFGGREFHTPRQHGLGSGVIVTEDGYILTNNHVVDGADEVKVALQSGAKEYDARVVGRDPMSDVAVLKIEASDLPVATLGDSDYVEVGDIVLAIGNPFGVGQSVSMGIVSATQRASRGLDLDYEDFIQTDAAINPGNSGGALVDAEGRLIGINTAILSRSGGNNGIGFAVPINMARHVMESLVQDGRVVRGFLGVNIQDVDDELARAFDLDRTQGALVAEVVPDSPADKSGLQAGDVVLQFNGKEIRDSRHLKLQVGQTDPSAKVPVKILRKGQERELSVVLGELPKSGELASRTARGESGGSSESLVGVTVGDINAAARQRFDLPDGLQGALITDVEPDSAAYEAGLRPGDVIREINQQAVKSADDAVELTTNLEDRKVLLRVWSRGANRYVVVDESDQG